MALVLIRCALCKKTKETIEKKSNNTQGIAYLEMTKMLLNNRPDLLCPHLDTTGLTSVTLLLIVIDLM